MAAVTSNIQVSESLLNKINATGIESLNIQEQAQLMHDLNSTKFGGVEFKAINQSTLTGAAVNKPVPVINQSTLAGATHENLLHNALDALKNSKPVTEEQVRILRSHVIEQGLRDVGAAKWAQTPQQLAALDTAEQQALQQTAGKPSNLTFAADESSYATKAENLLAAEREILGAGVAAEDVNAMLRALRVVAGTEAAVVTTAVLATQFAHDHLVADDAAEYKAKQVLQAYADKMAESGGLNNVLQQDQLQP